MKNFYFLVLLFSVFLSTSQAQTTHFSQFYASSTYLNPALAGIASESQLTLNYRNHWPEISNSFISYNASFEMSAPKLNSGFAVNAYSDRAGDGTLTITSYSGVYSYEARLSKEVYMRAGIKAGIVQKSVNWNNLVFEDMIDSREGIIYDTQQRLGGNISYFDVSTGLFLYSETYYGGFSIDHVNRAKAGLINKNGKSTLQQRYTAHGGAKFILQQNKNYSVSPNTLISRQGTFTKINVGLHFELNSLLTGMWYASDESLILMLGVKAEHFQLGYSYDIYSSTLTGSRLNSHEISYRQSFNSKKKRPKKYRTTPCPKF